MDGPILLPCVKISEVLGCIPTAVSRYRRLAIRYRLLKLTSKGIKAQRKADEFNFSVERFDWESGKEIASENLNLCLTSPAKCYIEIQEEERKKESQEKQESKDIQEMQRETRAQFPVGRKRYSTRQGPYIPTTAELTRELEQTKHLRRR